MNSAQKNSNHLPKIILVLGMHRSGTSLVAQLIAKWGAFMGDDLMPADDFNSDGYWEYNPLVRFHEKLLEKTNNKWYAPSEEINTKELLFEFGDEARKLVKKMDQAREVWCWKEPRMSLFMDFWNEILTGREIIYIMVNRPPNDIASSLLVRDKMPAILSLSLWEYTTINIFQKLSNESNYRLVDYEKIILHPEISCKDLFNYLNKSSQLNKSQNIYNKMVQSVKRPLNHAKPGRLILNQSQRNLQQIIEKGEVPTDYRVSEYELLFLKEIFSLYGKLGINNQIFQFAQLFYKNKNNAYDENFSLIKEVRGFPQTIHFKFDNPQLVNNLRFDPLNDYLQVQIISIELIHSGKPLDAPFTLSSNAISSQNSVYLFESKDPQIYICFENDVSLEIDEVIIDLNYIKIGGDSIDLCLNSKNNIIKRYEEENYKRTLENETIRLQNETLVQKIIIEEEEKHVLKRLNDAMQLSFDNIKSENKKYLEEIINLSQEKKELTEYNEHLNKSLNIAEEKNQNQQDLLLDLFSYKKTLEEQNQYHINGNKSLEYLLTENQKSADALAFHLNETRFELENLIAIPGIRYFHKIMNFFKLIIPVESIRGIFKSVRYSRNYYRIKYSDLFDEEYYLNNNSDVKSSGIHAIKHFLLFGGFEGRNPSEKFDSSLYLEQNLDVMKSGMNPLVHYLKFGMKEERSPISGKNPQPSDPQNITEASINKIIKTGANIIQRIKGYPDLQLLRNSEYFNAEYYLRMNPDVKAAELDPAEHYLYHGWKEGRNPSELFDTNFYLKKNGDVRQANINPLLHFVEYGESENRICTETSDNYILWIKKYDTLSPADIIEMQEALSLFKAKPLISVLMPVFNPNPLWLKEAINSIINQIYPFWELCIADDCSTDAEIKSILDKYHEQDSRIKVVFRSENGHISAASNSALELATGEFAALLDHDDILPIHALYWVANTINMNPGAKLIYSDEDKIDLNGIRQNPYFKCDWNRQLFYAQNMISHLGVYYIKIVKKIGGFREGFDGSQDYDLALRFIENISNDDIIHIPKVLYHWRMHEDSVSLNVNSKNYAYTAAINALKEHFHREGIKASVTSITNGLFRIQYSLPDDNPLVSIIIPTKNKYELLKKCVDSILTLTIYKNIELIIIDNLSDESKSIEYLHKLDETKKARCFKYDIPFNFSKLVNYGVTHSNGEFVCLMNNDIEVINPEWLEEMLSLAKFNDVGAVGAKLLYPNNSVQHGGVILGIGGVASHAHKHIPANHFGYFGRAAVVQQFSAVTAACLLIKKSIFLEIGGFNENDLAIAFNDVDFCLRLKEAGYRNIWTPFAQLYHHESVSRGEDNTEEKQLRLQKEIDYMKTKWGTIIERDPAYNTNLTLTSENFELAWPPRNNSSLNIIETQ